MLDGVFSFVLLDMCDNSFIVARDAIGITPLYIGWGLDGTSLDYLYVRTRSISFTVVNALDTASFVS